MTVEHSWEVCNEATLIAWTFIPVPGMPDDAARAFVGQISNISGSVDPDDLDV